MMVDASHDTLLLIRIEGMHCHRCEEAITRCLLREQGVQEVEVDFPSAQASVLIADGSEDLAAEHRGGSGECRDGSGDAPVGEAAANSGPAVVDRCVAAVKGAGYLVTSTTLLRPGEPAN